MHLEKFQVDKIQNGRLSAIIHLDRPDIFSGFNAYIVSELVIAMN